MKLGDGEFFGPPGHQPRSLLCDDRRNEAGLLQQFDPHSVPSIELFPLIARLGIIHAGIGKDSIYIRGKQPDFPQKASQGFLLSFQFHRLIASKAGRPGKNPDGYLNESQSNCKGFCPRAPPTYMG
jgi:hypothetical protein